jgi:transposase-like protein
MVGQFNCRIVIYSDGQRFGPHRIISAVGVDREGRKHILGLEAGATENAAAGSNRRRH